MSAKRKPKVKTDLLGEYTSLTHEVCKQHLEQVAGCPMFHLQRRLRLHEGARHRDSDLTIAIDQPWGGTMIKGDFVVDGDLIIEDREIPALLFVVGDLRAKNILNLGCRIVVKGNVTTGAFISSPRQHDGPYRNANVCIDGSLHADAIAGEIGASMGANREIFVGRLRHSDEMVLRFFSEDDDPQRFFAPGLLTEGGLDLVAVRHALAAGEPIATGMDSADEVSQLLNSMSASATSLDLSGRKLSTIPDRVFELRELTTLILADNRLDEPDPRLASLKKLRELDLRGNHGNPLGPIEALQQLRSLAVPRLEATAQIRQLTELETLIGESTTFPIAPEVFELEQLRTLRLGCAGRLRSKANDIPELLGKLSKLEHLAIDRGVYQVVPDALGDLHQLEHLELRRCTFRKRGMPSFGSLRKLRRVIFEGREFADAKPNTAWLEDILDALEGSPLTHLALPGWGRPLNHLRASGKRIVRDPLGHFPDRFGTLTKLEELDLSDNGLVALPESLFELPLRRLDVRKNPLLAPAELLRAREAFELVEAS